MDCLIYREATSLLLSDFFWVGWGKARLSCPMGRFQIRGGGTLWWMLRVWGVCRTRMSGGVPPRRKAAKKQLLFCPKTKRISGKNGVHFCPRKFLFSACVGREISGQFVGRQLLCCNHQAKESPLMVVGCHGTLCCTSLRRSPAISCRNPMRSPLGKRGRRLREC